MSSTSRLTRMPLRIPRSGKQDVLPTNEDHRAQFYEAYRREAEEYDKEFMKKHDEDLNTTLIFVSFTCHSGMRVLTRSQAGLFSAVASAFIIDVQSQLQPDTGEETAALLRVLIHKTDNTTFGDDPPTVPQWTGPPHPIVQVQAILYASLATSLLSAFLAMLGKQWLNRYVSTDVRGTAIERSQNRQRKLDGIVTWYFDNVMELLPLMLQAALLLLGCALSRYLWDINVTVASVVLGITSSGFIFYIFIISAGATYGDCPYQTPGSHALRYLKPPMDALLNALRDALRDALRRSETVKVIGVNIRCHRPWRSRGKIVPFLKDMVVEVPLALAFDFYCLGKAIVWPPIVGVYHLGSKVAVLLVSRLRGSSPALEQGVDQQPVMLDLRCISWMLQTSLDKTDHLLATKHLATLMPLANFDPALVLECFNTFVGCINISNRKTTIVEGLEHLATVSAVCFLRAFHHLSAMNPTSSVLEDIRQRHNRDFLLETDFGGLLWYYSIARTYGLVNQPLHLRYAQWGNHRPSAQEHITFAWGMVEAAQIGARELQRRCVPRWILRFTLYSLSLDPLPPTSVIANCLSIIAIDLGCDISSTGAPSEIRCVRIRHANSILTLSQCTSGTTLKLDH